MALFDRVADPELDSRWDLSTKRIMLVILLVVMVVILYVSRSVLPLILLAAILAYLLNQIVNFFQRFRIPRFLSTLAIYLLVISRACPAAGALHTDPDRPTAGAGALRRGRNNDLRPVRC